MTEIINPGVRFTNQITEAIEAESNNETLNSAPAMGLFYAENTFKENFILLRRNFQAYFSIASGGNQGDKITAKI